MNPPFEVSCSAFPADLKVALEDLEQESDSRKQVQQVPLRRRWAWAALLPVLLVGGFLAWWAWRAPESTEPLRAVPLTALPGVTRYPSLSPDGNYVVFSWNGPKQDNPDIWVQQIGVGGPMRLTTDPGNDYNPVWSPDGRSIAFLRGQVQGQSELWLIPPLGGPGRKLAEIRVRQGVFPPYLAWCADSNCLFAANSTGEGKPDALFLISLETGDKKQFTYPQYPAPGDTNPTVSPDGGWLVFRRDTSGPFTGELHKLRLGKDPVSGGVTGVGAPERLTPATLDARQPTWTPDSKEILFSRGLLSSLWRLNVSGEKPGESQPARLAFVGEDGIMPVVSRPTPLAPAAPGLRSQFRG